MYSIVGRAWVRQHGGLLISFHWKWMVSTVHVVMILHLFWHLSSPQLSTLVSLFTQLRAWQAQTTSMPTTLLWVSSGPQALLCLAGRPLSLATTSCMPDFNPPLPPHLSQIGSRHGCHLHCYPRASASNSRWFLENALVPRHWGDSCM